MVQFFTKFSRLVSVNVYPVSQYGHGEGWAMASIDGNRHYTPAEVVEIAGREAMEDLRTKAEIARTN